MVDSIGWKAITPPARTSASTAPTAAAPVRAADTPAADVGQTAGVSKQLSAQPPVDSERVARIKAAIAAGKFPILPSTIADRLLAFKLEWSGHE